MNPIFLSLNRTVATAFTRNIRAGSPTPIGDFEGESGNGGGGGTYGVSNSIDRSGVTNPAPEGVYQNERYGTFFYYVVSGLPPSASLKVRLHFAEIYSPALTTRRFHVDINSVRVLNNFSIFSEVGAAYKACVKEFITTVKPNGEIAIDFFDVAEGAKVSAFSFIAL